MITFDFEQECEANSTDSCAKYTSFKTLSIDVMFFLQFYEFYKSGSQLTQNQTSIKKGSPKMNHLLTIKKYDNEYIQTNKYKKFPHHEEPDSTGMNP